MMSTKFSADCSAIALSSGQGWRVASRKVMAAMMALTMGVTCLTPWQAASAQSRWMRGSAYRGATYNPSAQSNPSRSDVFPNRYNQTAPNGTVASIPAGTTIPVISETTNSIKIAKGESQDLTLSINANLRQANGTVLIPAGSSVSGRLQATEQGVQFVAQQVTLPNGQSLPFNATSRLLVGYDTEQTGASTADIVLGTLAGAGAGTLIAGTTGDRHINALEVLGGAAVGALAGWGLPSAGIVGGGTREVMTLDPNQDLTLTLQAPLNLNGSGSSNGWSRPSNGSYTYR
ncbi:MAG: hypothetical protein ACKO1W_03925 [Microcystaceae cyanobacterium]